MDSSSSQALRYVACAVGEGVFFVSLFAVIFYLRKLNLFKNFIESNEQISKDESIHRDHKAWQAKVSLKKEEHSLAKDIMMSGVEIEIDICRAPAGALQISNTPSIYCPILLWVNKKIKMPD